ncbi:fMet-Leu-Phe receptor-like [Mobula birostris]|uniref:fMet-Leu-Phe receptor-like n=1 Tax=Mobula birostris TaxID=1983395 RepID=UPI003B27FC88
MLILEDSVNLTAGSNYTSKHPDLPLVSKWTTIPYTITFLLGVPGNSAAIWVTGFKMDRSIYTTCFLYLAVADLICCLIIPFWMVVFALPDMGLSNYRWDISLESAIAFNGSVRVFILTLISILRCIAVTRPIWFYQHMRLRWVYAAFFGVSGLSILFCITVLLNGKIALYIGPRTWDMKRVTWAIIIFVLPVVIMTICCALIGLQLHRDKFTQSRNPIRLTMTVVAAFIASWLPFHSSSFASFFFDCDVRSSDAVTIPLAFFNSALNPFLYVFTGSDFRQVFRRSLASSLRLAFSEEAPEFRTDTPNPTIRL